MNKRQKIRIIKVNFCESCFVEKCDNYIIGSPKKKPHTLIPRKHDIIKQKKSSSITFFDIAAKIHSFNILHYFIWPEWVWLTTMDHSTSSWVLICIDGKRESQESTNSIVTVFTVTVCSHGCCASRQQKRWKVGLII